MTAIFGAPLEMFTSDPGGYFWIWLMGFLIISSCGLVGTFLVLRKSALIGDAISHSVLPGIVIAFLLTTSRAPWIMIIGALVAGLLTTVAIDLICRKTRIKEDAAIGIVFSSFFAVGVILISVYASKVHLDADCVLYGEIGYIALEPFVSIGGREWMPGPVGVAALVLAGVAISIFLLYKELLVSSFDPTFSTTIGISRAWVHYLLIVVVSITIVSAFESVGAILVIAMLILPGSTAYLVLDRLPHILATVLPFAALTAAMGVYFSILFNCSTAGSMVVSGFGLFLITWFVSPNQGLIAQWRRRQVSLMSEPSA